MLVSKVCKVCGINKPISEFYTHKLMKSGYWNECKECISIRVRRNRTMRRSEDIVKERMTQRASAIQRDYGITIVDYEDIYNYQQGRCAITGIPMGGRHDEAVFGKENILHLDHDKSTGLLRELLLPKINKALGIFNHDPDLMMAGVRYLLKWQQIHADMLRYAKN